MKNRWDFMAWLGPDISTSVIMRLTDPADLMHVGSVSRSWRRFVIANGFCKELCLRMSPEVSNFTRGNEVSGSIVPVQVASSTVTDWESLEREHKIYTYLIHGINSPMEEKNCILESVIASSTDRSCESIENTLRPSNRARVWHYYWSSKGESDPRVPETLTYRLVSRLCVINEIKIQPYKELFQQGYYIYSAKSVRFRMGHFRLPQETGKDMTDEYATGQLLADDSYVWTYVSSEFPMLQENVLQSFKLPRPVVCIGGIVQIELLGRVEKHELNDLYYLCVSHVQVLGYPLSPVLDVDILGAARNPVLNHFPDALEDEAT